MINNNQKLDEQNFSINTLYIKNRKSIIEIIKLINNALYNSSQTFFLCLYYMDLIFNNNNFDKIFKLFYEDKEDDLTIEINKYDILMISLSCLIIATKYNENDPNVPNIISFINLCSYYSYNKFNYKVSDITRAEVIVLKFLEYKLNYFTIYHYFSFFFTHGFLFENIFEKEIIKKNNYKKDELLEKIYILSREIMNKFVEDNDNIIYILGNNIYYSSIQILIWSTEHILNISFLELFKEEKNIFTLLYKIDLEDNKENNEKIKNKIQNIYDDIQKKGKKRNDNNYSNIEQFNTENKDNKDNKENYLQNSNSKKINNNININNQNNNLLISCDNYYLQKYKNNNYLTKNLKKENINIKNKYAFYSLKYKIINKKNNVKSKSTNNYRYKQLFQFGNNINMKNKKYNYSSDKKKIIEEKEKEKEEDNNERLIKLENLVENLGKKFNIKSNCNKDKDSLNKANNNNLITLNYKYDNNKYNNTLYNIPSNNNINENKRDIVYKTQMILENLNYDYSNNNNNNNFLSSNNYSNKKESNFYYNKLYENKKDNIKNNKYRMKENIQDNNINSAMNINQYKNKNLDFIKPTKLFYDNGNLYYYNIDSYINNNTKYYKNEENKLNNCFSYGTYYQYGNLNKYENIDKFCGSYQKTNYIPYYFKNSNKYYY